MNQEKRIEAVPRVTTGDAKFFQSHFVSFWAMESKKWIRIGVDAWDGHHMYESTFGANKHIV